PGHPTAETISRLADALETTREDLMGGGHERPPGGAPAAAAPRLEKLDDEECLRLIAPGGIGRVAFNGSHGPTILPVNYKLHQGAIVFRTARGGEMDRDLRTGLEGVEIVVGFQVDRIDEVRRAGWSVLVQGPFHHVPEEELEPVIGAQVTPWAGGDRPLHIRIIPTASPAAGSWACERPRSAAPLPARRPPGAGAETRRPHRVRRAQAAHAHRDQ